MRLTLRTMLAFMDEVDLQPEDHQDIGRKIEESEFASNLMHRIRDVTRRMRLAAPKVAGRGMGLDPNTVAEYLDNELTGERVPDFEKICLESDVHLAEVACCHQILSIVLREAAEVDPALRNRMYAIVERADQRATDRAEPSSAAAASAAADGAGRGARGEEPAYARPKPEVPDYLRTESRSKFWPVAITAALAICLVAAIILASGPLDGTNPVLKLFGLGGDAGPANAQNDAGHDRNSPSRADNSSGGKTEPPPAAAATGTSAKADDRSLAPSAARTDSSSDVKNGTVPDKNSAEAAKGSIPPREADKGASVPGNPGLAQPSTERPAVVTPATSNERPTPVPPSPPAEAVNPAVVGPASPATRPIGPPTRETAVPVVPPGVAPADPFPGAPDAGEQRLGRLISDQEVLLRMAAGNAEWHRVAPGVAFNAGDKLLVLPTFRPTLALAAGISLVLVPETLIEFERTDQGVPVLRLHYGRIVMRTTGNAGVKIKLAMGAAAGTVVFDDADATIGAEVRPFHQPGDDPEAKEPRQAIMLYGISGDVSWVPARGEAEKLHAPVQVVVGGSPTPTTDREPPKWGLGAEPISPIDGRAAKALSDSLDEQRPVTQALLELANHRRDENRSLAGRSLALIDEFEPLVGLLSDERERSVWPIQIESLQAALARGPAVAAKVRTAFEKQRGKDGTELYRMLWGYSKEDLAAGAASRLVDYLDHDNMDFRVLSFYNLHQIVGATFNYRPEQSAPSRQQPIHRWREQLKEGLIGPKATAPAKLPVGEPAPTKSIPPPPVPDEK